MIDYKSKLPKLEDEEDNYLAIKNPADMYIRIDKGDDFQKANEFQDLDHTPIPQYFSQNDLYNYNPPITHYKANNLPVFLPAPTFKQFCYELKHG